MDFLLASVNVLQERPRFSHTSVEQDGFNVFLAGTGLLDFSLW